MRRRADRYAVEFSVELYSEDWHERAAVQDISSSGVFLETATEWPVGASVRVAIAPDGSPLATAGRVSHAIGPRAARELGRASGVGIEFRAPRTFGDELFAIAIGRLIRSRRAAAPPPSNLHVVVADRQSRLLERMSTAFDDAGFSVSTATNGMDALAACLRRRPDVVLAECELPIVDGFGVASAIARDQRLARIPILMMSAASHRAGEALACGATDFITKPFAAHAVIERARQLALPAGSGDRVVMAGSLEHLGLAALLTMLENTRKSGRLALTDPAHDATTWIDLVDGRIVDAGPSSGPGTALAAVLSALDWTDGTFELVIRQPIDRPTLGGKAISITHVLFEYARLRDEASRRHARHARHAARAS